ncbi:MAG: HEAT repeat domain-containing protein [Anaerolineae bacterium]
MIHIESLEEALKLLDDVREAPAQREAAVHYLGDHSSPQVIVRLVQALQDDDFGVRWEAALTLTQLGEPAVIEVLKALADPKRVDDPRLREGAYHILRNGTLPAALNVTDLLTALRGQAADISSLVEAYRLLCEIDHVRLVEKAQESMHSRPSPGLRPFLLGPQYGSAQLTGRLSRLGIHHSK